MMKKQNVKKLLALILSIAVFLGAFPAISVFADSNVTFTAQTIAEGFRDDVVLTREPGTITMPSCTSAGTNLRTGWRNNSGWRPGNCEVSGWLWNGKYYAVGEVVNNVPAGANFTAVYGNDAINFNEMPTAFKFRNGSDQPSYGSSNVSIVNVSEGNNALQFAGVSGAASRSQGAMVYARDNQERALSYTPNATYKITFKYRRTDNTSNEAKIWLAFGLYLFDWFPESQAIQTNQLVTTKSNMSEFETVTATVTAPNTYKHGSQGYASRALGFRVDTQEDVTIQIDDIKIETTLGRDCVSFTYGEGNGVVGTDSEELVDSEGNVTLPTNDSAMNLNWSNGGKLFEPGTTVSVNNLVKDNDGKYKFVAMFGSASVDFDEIDTNPFTFNTGSGAQTKDAGFFEQLTKNDWWGIPAGYGNDGKKIAFGASVLGIKKRPTSSGAGNYLVLREWQGEYYNAALFTHSLFDTKDANSHNSNASGKINYQYVYFTPGEEYTLSFDYMIDASNGGTAPYTASIAFGMDTKEGNANCGQKTIQYASGSVERTSVDLGTESKVWKKATITLKAPDSYTGNDITSGRVGISIKAKVGTGVYIDNIKFELKGPVKFNYGDAAGTTQAIGFNTTGHINGDGTITLPENENAINLLWENNGKLYVPGTKVNADSLGDNLTFNAYFGAANLNFDEIDTNPFTFNTGNGAQTKDSFFEQLTKNDWWGIPAGYGNDGNKTALGASVLGIKKRTGTGEKGNYLAFREWQGNNYYNAALFTHSPFDKNDANSHNSNASGKINYQYVYFTPGEEYTLSFDYMIDTTAGGNAPYTASIAFGMDTKEGNANCGQKTIQYANSTAERTSIDLGTESKVWKKASITIKAPDSYTGNSVTSARVGISINAHIGNGVYIDNIQFYPTKKGNLEFVYGGADESFTDSNNVVSHFAAGTATPSRETIVATKRNGSGWSASYGNVSVDGWLCNETGEIFEIGEVINAVPVNATFKAVYGNKTFNFDDLSDDFVIYTADNTSYGSQDTVIKGTDNKYVNISSSNPEDNMKYSQFIPAQKLNNKYAMAGFTKDAQYIISFKYKRTDNTDVNSDLYVSFGALSYYWRAEKQAVNKVKVASTKKNMTEYETVTVVLTAPASYVFDNNESETFASRAIGFGATISNGVSIDIDDFSVVCALGNSYVTFDENIGDCATTNEIISSGTTMTELPKPSYDGFEFCGWYDNRMGEGKAVTSVLGDGEQKVYYAKWVPTLSGNAAGVTINGTALSNCQIDLPEIKTLVLADSLGAFKDLVVSKGASTEEKANKIIVEDTSSKALTAGDSSYTIKVENNNLVVTATDDAAMAGALDRLSQFIETAYEKNKVLNFAADFEFTQKYVADDSQYAYTWSDEFNAEDLDKSIWLNSANYKDPKVSGYQIGKNNWFTGDPEELNATTGRYTVNSQGIYLENGSAVIRAEKVDAPDAAGNDHYFINRNMSTIGAVEYTYGCIEIKAKLPAHPAAPQIWIYSSRDVATSAEIDLHEGIGTTKGYENNQQIVSNIHASYHLSSDANKWKTSLDDSNNTNRFYLGNTKTNYDEAYHIYSVKWTPDEVMFALDGEVYYTYNFNTDTDLIDNATVYDSDSPFNGLTAAQIKECFSKQMYIVLGNSMGTVEGEYGPVYESGDPAQADLLVDYVRVYQSADNKGSTFMNRPYSQEKIAEVDKAEKAFIKEMGIENRGETTKEVVLSAEGLETETIKINKGDYLPVNYAIGSKYIYGWTDGTNSVKTYKDSTKTYTPQFIDLNMLDITYKVSDAGNGNSNLLFTSTVDANWADYSKAGFVYSESQATPTIGAGNCISVETTKVYQDGLISGSDLLDSEVAGYTAYSKYMFNFALKDIALSGREKDINIRSYVVLSDGRVVYGDVLTISAEEVLAADVESEFDNFIIERLATGATLDNLVDYNDDNKVDIFDLIRAKKISEGLVESDTEINAITLSGIRKVLVLFDFSKVK